jgi:lipopolysaccharide/colanic/teichoic acid biosynthesis glycosyltransferase
VHSIKGVAEQHDSARNAFYVDPALELPAWYLRAKIVLDFILALVLLVLAAPIILVCAVVVKCSSRGPAFYTQTRVGRSGRPFMLIKIRTMVHNCESATGPCWAAPHDPRITKVGRFLRRAHLDELPQLWNVLRGDMSLVGPRPERPEFVEKLDQIIPSYRARMLVRPGLTGLAQVWLPPDTDLNSVRRKLSYDVYYIGHCSGWLDFRLLAVTAGHLVWVSSRWLRCLFAIPGPELVEKASAPELGTSPLSVGTVVP